MPTIGMFMNLAQSDTEAPARIDAFKQGLQLPNATIEPRYGAGDYKNYGTIAAQLVALQPDAIFAACGPSAWELLEKTKTIPIVYAAMIESYTPDVGNNATGFHSYGIDRSVQWLELLKEIEPKVTQAAVIWDRDPDPKSEKTAARKQVDALQARASALGVQLTLIDVNGLAAIEGAIAAAARANGGLIVTASTLAAVHRKVIIDLVAKHRLPAVYPNRMYVTSGGLISYGAQTLDMYQRAGEYVAHILNERKKPHQLLRQKNAKFETVVNLKTAAALGFKLPPAVLDRADKV